MVTSADCSIFSKEVEGTHSTIWQKAPRTPSQACSPVLTPLERHLPLSPVTNKGVPAQLRMCLRLHHWLQPAPRPHSFQESPSLQRHWSFPGPGTRAWDPESPSQDLMGKWGQVHSLGFSCHRPGMIPTASLAHVPLCQTFARLPHFWGPNPAGSGRHMNSPQPEHRPSWKTCRD